MNDFYSNSMVEAVARYKASKAKFHTVLASGMESNVLLPDVVIKRAEEDFAQAFYGFLDVSVSDLSDVMEKSKTIIDEVVSENELPSYHAAALRVIFSDLETLIKK